MFFKFCAERNLRLHQGKCVLFARSIHFCSRLICSKGIRYDPFQLKIWLYMEPLSNGAHLRQFHFVMQFVEHGVPILREHTNLLQKILERIYDNTGKRTKSSVDRVQMSALWWSTKHIRCFKACNRAHDNQVTLECRGELNRLCVYADALDNFWSGIITNIRIDELYRFQTKKRH